jgi:hypothetical protein
MRLPPKVSSAGVKFSRPVFGGATTVTEMTRTPKMIAVSLWKFELARTSHRSVPTWVNAAWVAEWPPLLLTVTDFRSWCDAAEFNGPRSVGPNPPTGAI